MSKLKLRPVYPPKKEKPVKTEFSMSLGEWLSKTPILEETTGMIVRIMVRGDQQMYRSTKLLEKFKDNLDEMGLCTPMRFLGQKGTIMSIALAPGFMNLQKVETKQELKGFAARLGSKIKAKIFGSR